MKFSEVSSLGLEDLQKKKADLVQELFVSKMKNRMGQLAQPLQVRFLRKDLARVETAMTSVRSIQASAPKSASAPALTPKAKKVSTTKKVSKAKKS